MRQGVDLVIGSHPHFSQWSFAGERREFPTVWLFIHWVILYRTWAGNIPMGGGMVKVVLGRKGLRRYIVSAQYSLIYSSRYKNEQGKEDIRVVPAASWSGKNQNSSFSVDSALIN